ncbi:hypothetical protein HMPREF0578_0788 [Mobiluncus mulieris 28-1]|uniref:hypothetical protein n=2 Tax=Mobiluncus mulieris TaxID=2052 RepID=UPI0001BE7EB3|nr:hypothetical protein [Mobiluncus mulieris]EEZ91726.1 hypothetical protein HMPREF0578_0788 [Mobiluncus mulieris 28-1]
MPDAFSVYDSANATENNLNPPAAKSQIGVWLRFCGNQEWSGSRGAIWDLRRKFGQAPHETGWNRRAGEPSRVEPVGGGRRRSRVG